MNTDLPRLAIAANILSDDPRQAAGLARTHGFAGLLFDAYSKSFNIPDLSTSGRREFRHVLASEDRQLVGLRCDLGQKGLRPGADVDRVISQLDRAMESAAGLQAPLVCVDLGPLPIVRETVKPKPKITQDQAGLLILPESFSAAPAPESTNLESIPPNVDPIFEAQVSDALAEIGRSADRYDVMVALGSELASFASLASALRNAGCAWFGIDLDPLTMLRDDWSSDEIFSMLGSLIRHVRGRDAVRGADRRTKATIIGKGDTKWDELFSNLDASGYPGWMTIDPVDLNDRIGAARIGKTYLESMRG